MFAVASQALSETEESLLLLDLAERMVQARDLRGLTETFLGGIAALSEASAAILFLKKTALPMETFSRWAWPLRRCRWLPACVRSASRSARPHWCRLPKLWSFRLMARPGCTSALFPGGRRPWGCWESSGNPRPLPTPA
jgi:hypothetical protein